MKKISIFSIFLFLIFNSLLAIEKLSNTNQSEKDSNKKLSGCVGSISKNFLINQDQIPISLIEVDVNKYRNWTVNGIRILTNRYRYVDQKYKKRFKGKVTVTYGDGTKCFFDARIRHSGDEKDHIALLDNAITQSLDIHLKNGHIRGITKFKLLRPKARGILEDEIFITEILRNINFIAPRTIKVNARVNTLTTTMLFQEKAAKEMLEFNNRREGPIFEGDERFFFKDVDNVEDNQVSGWSIGIVDLMNQNAKYMLAKQVNSFIATRSNGQKQTSLEATSKLNNVYLYFASRFQDKINKYNYMEYDLDNNLLALFDNEKTRKLDEYNIFIQAVNGQHGLAINNRKFFWNAIENYFEPINYDSNSNISNDITPNLVRLPISEQFYDSFFSIKNKLDNLDIDNLEKNLKLSGLEIDQNFINSKINKIKFNIDQLEKNYLNLDEQIITHNNFNNDKNLLDNYNQNLKKSDIDLFLVNYNLSENKFNKCEVFLENCEFFELSDAYLASLLGGNLVLDDKAYQYLGKKINFDEFKNKNFKNELKFKDTRIFYEEGISISIDEINNRIEIQQIVPGARIHFLNGFLKDTQITFRGINTENYEKRVNDLSADDFPIDINGLTGCVTFSNLELQGINVKAMDSSCEDTINFVNVFGSIKDINIKNSFSDALDIDFSNVKISNIEITNSRNDCTDFSSGNYNLINMNLQNCGDKALSIGEKSIVKTNYIFAKNSNFGVASKDSSLALLQDAVFDNLNICLAAYNKKQEFDGAVIETENLQCNNSNKKIDTDSRSQILLKN